MPPPSRAGTPPTPQPMPPLLWSIVALLAPTPFPDEPAPAS